MKTSGKTYNCITVLHFAETATSPSSSWLFSTAFCWTCSLIYCSHASILQNAAVCVHSWPGASASCAETRPGQEMGLG